MGGLFVTFSLRDFARLLFHFLIAALGLYFLRFAVYFLCLVAVYLLHIAVCINGHGLVISCVRWG
jgi:hypothetical protein